MIFNDPYFPVMIDEEGGSVSRLSDLINSKELSQVFFGNLYKKSKKEETFFPTELMYSRSSKLVQLGTIVNKEIIFPKVILKYTI